HQENESMKIDNMESLLSFDKSLKTDVKEWLGRSESLFGQARDYVEQQISQSEQLLEEEFRKEVEGELAMFQTELTRKQDQFTDEQRQRIEKIRERVLSQAKDNQRRRKQSYDDI